MVDIEIEKEIPLLGSVPLTESSYLIYSDGTTFFARNGITGNIDFSGTGVLTVIQNAINALSSGVIYLRGIQRPTGLVLAANITLIEEFNGVITFYGLYGHAPYTLPDMKVLRFKMENVTSKPILEWIDRNGKKVAWIVAHENLDDVTVHKHISIETIKADMITQVSRLAVTYGADRAVVETPNSYFKVYNGNVPIIKDRQLKTANETRFTVSGLDISIFRVYEIELRLRNNTLSDSNYSLYVNSDETDTNYYNQNMIASGASVTAARTNNAVIGAIPAGMHGVLTGKLWKDIVGNSRGIFHMNVGAPAGVNLLGRAWINSTVVANITQLDIVADIANAISTGSEIIVTAKYS